MMACCDTGQFLNDVGRHAAAADSYVTASQLSADDFELIFNTASALRSYFSPFIDSLQDISILCPFLFFHFLASV